MTKATREKSVQQVFGYHERTKHQFGRYARAPLGLGWDTQPNPFLRYTGASLVSLRHVPVSEVPRYEEAFIEGNVTPRALDRESVSQLFTDSLALSAWKQAGDMSWSLRTNPSSGNLHPTEAYLLCGPVEGLCERVLIGHYAAKEHALERRGEFDLATWRALSDGYPQSTIFVGLTSIHWREAWKYGERAYRYCQHDLGHAIAALSMAAAGLGWQATLMDELGTDEVAKLLGVHGSIGPEAEVADAILAIHPQGECVPPRFSAAVIEQMAAIPWQGTACALSPEHVEWSCITDVSTAVAKPASATGLPPRETTGAPLSVDHAPVFLREIIRQRRSAVALDGRTGLARDGFYQVLRKVPSRTATVSVQRAAVGPADRPRAVRSPSRGSQPSTVPAGSG
ncbi:MAG: SagB/ThcOx family dehydrogenase [Nannocystaceae bacterium]